MNKSDVVIAPDEITTQDVPVDVTACMPEVAEVVNRDSTAVDRCLAGLQRFKVFGAIAEAVCEAQWQRSDQALQGGYGPFSPGPPLIRLVAAELLPICCFRWR